MRAKGFTSALALVSLSAAAFGQTPAPNTLVLSEIGAAAPGSAEFTEIYNPTNSPVDVTNYYVSDHNLYFDLPSVVAGTVTNTLNNTSDHLVKLPAGMIIPPGGVLVLCHQASTFLNVYFEGDITKFTSLPGAPQLAEVNETMPSIPNVAANYNRQSPEYPLADPGTPVAGGNNLNHTDTDENEVLFFWDGSGPLVKDIDMVQWRAKDDPWGASSNQTANKSGVLEQGPSTVQGSYALDAGNTDQLTVHFPQPSEGEVGSGNVIRRYLLEPGETHTGGNGLNGDDESLEKVDLSWELVFGSSSNGSPGLVDFGPSSTNQPPVVGVASRNTQFPAPGAVVHITCAVYDEGTPTVKLMVDKGTGTFVATTMVNEGGGNWGADISTAGLAEGTHIKYYVTATDSGNLTTRETDQTFLRQAWPGYHVFMVKTAPISPNDVIVSEVMYNPQGTNNYTNVQYFELYNPANTPLNIGSWVIIPDFTDTDGGTPAVSLPPTKIVVPEGTIIPAKGYVVVAGHREQLQKRFPGIDASRIVPVDIEPGRSFMAHAGSTFYFFGPNDFFFNDLPVDNAAAFKSFHYENNTNGWPQGSTAAAPPGTTAGDQGYSIELKSLVPGSENTGSNWGVGQFFQGSPTAPNSIDTTLRPGDVSVIGTSRTLTSPTSTDVITINTAVTHSNPLLSVKVIASANNGTAVQTNMTSGDGVNYTANIGPFPDKTLVEYWIEATDVLGSRGTWPKIAPNAIVPFRVDNASPFTNLVINEIMYNPTGTDNGNYPEFIELYNAGSTAMDVSYFQYGTSSGYNGASTRIIPKGTVIPPKDYLVLAGRKSHFLKNYVSDVKSTTREKYGQIDPNLVIGSAWSWLSSIIVNTTGGRVDIVEPNLVDYTGATSPVSLNVQYLVASPWPPADGNRSIELNTPSSPQTASASWSLSIPYNGTPQNRNSVTPPPAGVSDWTIY